MSDDAKRAERRAHWRESAKKDMLLMLGDNVVWTPALEGIAQAVAEKMADVEILLAAAAEEVGL